MGRTIKHVLMMPLAMWMLYSCGTAEDQQVLEQPSVAVQVAEAQLPDQVRTLSISGRVEAGNSADVSTRMMGNVSSLKVLPGDNVQKGDLLLTISSDDLMAKSAQVDAAIVHAESGFENARRDLDRFEALYAKGSASEKEVENIRTRFEMAEAGLKAAREMKKEVEAQFSYTHLRAPFAGVVANTFVKVGDMANPGMPLVTVEGTTLYEATLLVPEDFISLIKVDAKATVTLKATGQKIYGIVTEVSPSSKNTGGQFIAKVSLNRATEVYPGMFVNAEIQVKDEKVAHSSPMVHSEALIQRGQLSGLYTISSQNTAVLRWVKTGESTRDKVEILSGLKAGESYILEAEGKLYNGVSVRVR